MHLLVAILLILMMIYFRSYNGFYKYLSSLWYLTGMNMLYYILTPTKPLWVYHNSLNNFTLIVDLWYLFIVLPIGMLTFLYLAKNKFNVHKLTVIAVILSCVWEWSFIKLDLIGHLNGWSMYCSFVLYFLMFYFCYLHIKKPLTVYLLSVVVIFFLMMYFHIPLDIK